MVGSVEPRPMVWEKIKPPSGIAEPQAPLVLPEPPPPIAAEPRLSLEATARRACRWPQSETVQRHPLVAVAGAALAQLIASVARRAIAAARWSR